VRRTQVADIRAKRDNALVRERLEALAVAAKGTENLMPRIIAAVKAEATVGEVCETLREVFGEYQERLVL
jgi:methylmalonyl-CoA mutase N-terminal domain/subunit